MSSLKKFVCALAVAVACVAGVAGSALAGVRPSDAATMHRLYNPNSGEHFYTANVGERDATVAAGWTYEGVGWYAPKYQGNEVYRLYNPNAGDHHYTMNAAERDVMVEKGWIYEGVGWFSDAKEEIAVWREYNPNAIAGAHNFTTSKSEHVTLCTLGWRGEGIGWYGVDPSGEPVTGISVDISGAAVPLGTTFDVSPYVHITPEDHTDDITWTSGDPNVVTVDKLGRITAVGEGETTVTVRSSSGKEATISIYVPREGSTVVAGPGGGRPSHWASVWACRGVLTSSQARELMQNATSRVLYEPTVMNVRASYDGRGLALSSDRLSDSLGADALAAIAEGTPGSYPATITVTGDEGVTASFEAGVTVVPDGTVIVRDNDDDPRHSAAIYAHNPETTYETGTELTREQLLSDVGARLWVDGVEQADLSKLGFDDDGLATKSAAGDVGMFEARLSYSDDNVSATANAYMDLDGPATLTMKAASSTAGVAGGTVEPSVTHLPSRLSTDVEFSATVTSVTLGYTFEGWYEGEVQSGTEPTGRMVSSEETFQPEVYSGFWPANGVFTAYFRANTNTPYSVTRYVQKLNAAGTGVMGTEHNLTNFEEYHDEDDGPSSWAGTTGELTSADVGGIEGFVMTPFEQKVIAGDGSTNIEVWFEREALTPTLLPNGKDTVVPIANPTVFGAKVPNPGNPSAVTGYDFTSWSQDEEGEDVWTFGDATMPAGGLTLYADWTPRRLVANLDDNGGTGGQGTCELVYGERPADVAVPTRENYIFCGYWAGVVVEGEELDVQYITRDGTWLNDFTGDEDLYLTAAWAVDGPVPYKVQHWQQRLNDEGTAVRGSEQTPENYELIDNATQTLRGELGNKTMAEFRSYPGFYGCAFAQKEILEDGTTVVDLYYNRFLTKPSLQVNGHGVAPASQLTPYGAFITDPGEPTGAGGVVFAGWYKDRDCTEPWDFATDTMPAGGVTLWAKWDSVNITRWETIGQMMQENINPIVGGAEVTLPEKPTYQGGAWHVNGPEQLAWVAYAANNGLLPAGTTTDILLTGDCDMTGLPYGGTADEPLLWTPIAGFAGTFDGADKSISVLRVSEDGPAGLIGTLGGPATIKSLSMSNWTVESASNNAGALMAYAGNSDLTIDGITATSMDVSGYGAVGGLVGNVGGSLCRIANTNLKNVTSSGTITGGLVGQALSGCKLECEHCVMVTCDVDAEASPCGGVCGLTEGPVDLKLVGVMQGTVSAYGALEDEAGYAGGLIGHATAPVTVDNAYATCEINATDNAAGLVWADDGVRVDVAHSYHAGLINDAVTSWAIASGDAHYSVCYYDRELLPVCSDGSDEGLTAYSTEQMRRATTAFYLNGSAFGSPWNQVNSQNAGYPVFGTLADTSPYTVKLDCVRCNTGASGTISQRVWYGRLADTITLPQLDSYTFDGYYSDYGGKGTKYIDENGNWVTPWDKPEGATLYANWKGNTIDYVFPYSWAKSMSQKVLYDQGWAFYNSDEAKVLPSEAEVGVTPGAKLVGWRINNEGEILTELPAGHTGVVRLYAYYIMGPAQYWGQTYFPMRDRIDGYPDLPTYDDAAGRWNVSSNLEIAYVVGAVNNGQVPRGRSTNMLMTSDIDLTGSETYMSSQGEVTLGGAPGSPLIWTPCNNYSGEFSGLGADAGGHELVRKLTTLKIANVYSSNTGGARFGEGYYTTGNATGIFKRLVNANVHDLIVDNPSVYAENTKKAGRTTFSTTATLAGIAEGTTRINRIGVEGGSVYIDHHKSMHNERIAGMVGTLRGKASIEDVYVRGTNVNTHAPNHNWRYQSSTSAGICVASQSGASVRNAYFQGVARATTSNVRQSRCGAVLATTAMVGYAINGSGATVENCYVDTSSGFKGSRADGACVRVAPADLKNKTYAYKLNGDALFDTWETTPWSRDTSTENPANAGYPTFGRLIDESPYVIAFDNTGAAEGHEGTTSQNVYFLQKPSNIITPKQVGYIFSGYWSEPGGTGKMYVNADGEWVDIWRELEPRTLYVRWSKIDNWGTVGKAVYDHDGVINAGEPPVFIEEEGGWQVTTPEQLAYVAYINTNNKVPSGTGRQFVLCADVDLTGARWGVAEGERLKWSNIWNFNKTFDGRGHIISSLRIEGGSDSGFFGKTAPGAVIRDVIFKNGTINAGSRIGLVVGHCGGSTSFYDVHTRDCTVYGSSDGVGGISGGSISNGGYRMERCSVEGGSVRGGSTYYTGGLWGVLYNKKKPTFYATDCFITATVNGRNMGGIFGDCYWDSRFYGSINVVNSYVAGPLSGSSSTYVISYKGGVTNCYYDSQVTGGGARGATPLTTQAMKSQVAAFKLNGNKLGGPWTQSDDVNGGYPYYGELTDYPELTVTLDNGEGATPASSTVAVKYTQVPDKLTELPTKDKYDFDGYYTGENGTGECVVDASGEWAGAYTNETGITLYAKWVPTAKYTVRHWQQKVNADATAVSGTDKTITEPTTEGAEPTCADYALEATQELEGRVGDDTKAEAKEYTGFDAPTTITQKTIAEDGTTVIDVFYDRAVYMLYFFDGEGATGGQGADPFMVPYGVKPPSTCLVPSLTGFEFAGYGASMEPSENVEYGSDGHLTATSKYNNPWTSTDDEILFAYWLGD